MGLFDFFAFKGNQKKPENLNLDWLKADMHSHLIPGIDDGSKTMEESLALVSRLHGLGLRKIITTPHVMSEYYRNTPETIRSGLFNLRAALAKEKIDVEIEAAAEYYLDEFFLEKVRKGESLLAVHQNQVLVETGFISKPIMLKEVLFEMEMYGYKPILAHPERYQYLLMDKRLVQDLLDRDVYFQVNLLSFTGFYSSQVKAFAETLLDEGKIRYLGTDCHNHRYLDMLESLPKHKSYGKLRAIPLMNHSL